MLKWTIGDVTITRVLESETPFLRGGGPESAVPQAFPEAVREIGWLRPHFADADGKMRFSIHALLVDAPGLKLVVDTCVGNDKPRNIPFWNMLQTGFLAEFEKTGWTRDAVDAVVCTHMHVDHVGWNTMLVDGTWVPTFPKARYLLGADEWKHWSREAGGEQRQILDDSIQPLFDANLVDLVPSDHRLSEEVRLVPTPGHTPGHVSVEIASRGALALITGDLMHHPCQIAHPEWSSNFDTDQAWSRRTRHAFLADVAARDALVIGTHFAAPTAGRVVREGEAWRLDVER
jgi:glyoxylase-like metal-dependent hydrolase (beta-lactamase superfamily II)